MAAGTDLLGAEGAEGDPGGSRLGQASMPTGPYIGFDAISTSSEEVREPSRTLPRAIIGSLLIATVLYILVAIVATGLLPTEQLAGNEAPLGAATADALDDQLPPRSRVREGPHGAGQGLRPRRTGSGSSIIGAAPPGLTAPPLPPRCR